MGLLDLLTGGARLKAERDLRARLGGGDPVLVDDFVLFLGRESAGRTQLRGNGCLIATAADIGFRMWLPRRELLIRRATIRGVDTTRSHLGKRIGRPLLRVRWSGEEGDDAGVWYVRDLDAWLAVLGTDG